MTREALITALGTNLDESFKVLTIDDSIDFVELDYGYICDKSTLHNILEDLDVYETLEELYIDLEFLYVMPRVIQKFTLLKVLRLNSGKLCEYNLSWLPPSVRCLTINCNSCAEALAMEQINDVPRGIRKLRLPFARGMSPSAMVLPVMTSLEQIYIPYRWRLQARQVQCPITFLQNYDWSDDSDASDPLMILVKCRYPLSHLDFKH